MKPSEFREYILHLFYFSVHLTAEERSGRVLNTKFLLGTYTDSTVELKKNFDTFSFGFFEVIYIFLPE